MLELPTVSCFRLWAEIILYILYDEGLELASVLLYAIIKLLLLYTPEQATLKDDVFGLKFKVLFNKCYISLFIFKDGFINADAAHKNLRRSSICTYTGLIITEKGT